MIKPNFFFIVGGQRCGSTYLYYLLDEHPEICMARPVRPEPKFFISNQFYSQGGDFYLDKYYSHRNEEKVYGEKSTSYFELEIAAQRMKQLFPKSKILIILRNPVERAISNYFFSVKNGYEQRTIEEAFLYNKFDFKNFPKNISASPYNYLNRGNYCDLMNKYFVLFHPENIKVVVLENLLQRISICNEIYKFLGVDPLFIPQSFNTIINRGLNKKKVPDKVISHLSDHYKKTIDELEAFMGYKITAWHK